MNSRRTFLATILLSLSGFSSIAAEKPDVLLLMPDQMRGDCISALGHPVVRTPNLDSLAKEGALFRRAYSTCPSCIPARYALLTGLHPATSGVVGYAGTPILHPTLPQLLDKAGYTTVLVGRYMHQVPEEDSYGYQKEVRGSTYVANDDYDTFLRHAAPETGGIKALVTNMGVSFNGWEAKPWPLTESLHPTVWIAGQAQKILTESAPDKPLFLTVSFYSPHPPLFPPQRFFDEYAKKPLPPIAHGDWVDWQALITNGDKQGHRVLLTGDVLRATQCGYFGQIDQVDEVMGPVIAAFKTRSEKAKRPWMIVFTADHGELLGDNGFFRKCEPYEGSANIPLVIAASPGLKFKAGLRSEQPVCLEDIMPTLLALAEVSSPKPMDGINLGPVLRGEKKDVRPILQFEHAPCYSKEQSFQALTDGHWKYIWRPLDGSEQLFDLTTDPHEEHDLTRVPADASKVALWRERLVKELAGRPEGFTDGKKLIAGRPYVALQAKAKE